MTHLDKICKPSKTKHLVCLPLIISVALVILIASDTNQQQAQKPKKDLDCNRTKLDDCGLAQGFSFIFKEHSYPVNYSQLNRSCKRQTDAYKCLKQSSKCLAPLSKQVLSAILAGRIKYNKRLCSDKPNEFNNNFVETFKCMAGSKTLMEKGVKAEKFASIVSEAIAKAKMNSSELRLKHACCAVSEIKRQYIEATKPNCANHSASLADLIDSYLADSISIICPDFEKGMGFCEKLQKLNMEKEAQSKFFILPVLDVVQQLAN